MSNLSIKEIKDFQVWDNFVKSQSPGLFVRSYLHGEFYKKIGYDYFIFGIYKDEKLIGGSLVLIVKAKRGKYFYLPYGPILNFDNSEELLIFRDFIKGKAKELKMDFVRVSPFEDDSDQIRSSFKKLGFVSAPMHVLAENTWLLDITPPEKKLFKNFRQSHRNLIRRGEREGVIVKQTKDVKTLDLLNELLQETAKRHNFTPFSKKYMVEEFKTFVEQDMCSIFTAEFNGEINDIAVIFYFGDSAVYRHSASVPKDKKVYPSYNIQWEVIKEAKRRGLSYYNFWGIAPLGATNHPFSGIEKFKTGFRGFRKDLVHCHDLPINFKYSLNYLIESLRKLKRGF